MHLDSSSSKGTKFENQVFELFSKLLKEDNFYLNQKTSKIFKKKGYYSLKREKEIIFDVTIETTLPNADKYSLLTIIECKNVNRKVGVEDLEEFGSKINQVGEHNTKGIIITTSTFQDTVLSIAKKEGIGLIRLNSDQELKWINFRKTSDSKLQFENDLELTDPTIKNEPFICKLGSRKITNFVDLFFALKIIDHFNDSEEFIEIPFISHERLNHIIERLNNYDLYDGAILNFDKLTRLMETTYGVKFELDVEEAADYLGKIEFNPLMIKISKHTNIDQNRRRFTLAHEIGHLILHSKLLSERLIEKQDTESTLVLNYSSSNKHSDKLEIQANLFASYLLLPEFILRPRIQQIFIEYRIHRKQLFLDRQPVNQKEVHEILHILSREFKVSIEAIKIRLIKLDLLVDHADGSLKTLIRKQFKRL